MNPENRFKRPGGTSPRSSTVSRVIESTGSSRTPVYLDDETLHRMIESFGPLEYSQFAATLNPLYGEQQDVFGATPSWQNDAEWSSQESGRRKGKSPKSDRPPSPGGRFVLPQTHAEAEHRDSSASSAKKESIIEWFDKSVENELKKRREPVGPTTSVVDPALAPLVAKHALNLSKGTVERMAETSASRIEISTRLESDFTSELTDAVEKLAKAETMHSYAEALQAAEQAAQKAPPELMEEAAAAEAKRIQAQVKSVKETIPGIRPIEVVGYVGITKPHYPKQSK